MSAARGDHRHDHHHGHAHGLSPHERSGAGIRAVVASLVILTATAAAQIALWAVTGSVALLADIVHNAGDALTAIPLAVAFLLRSRRAERLAGMFVVLVILASGVVALVEAIVRFIDPRPLHDLTLLAAAGLIGAVGNAVAAGIRLRAGRAIGSPALVADGEHARVDALVSLGVVATAALVGVGLDWTDPLVGLVISLVILRVTWRTWVMVRAEGDFSTLPR